MNMEFWKYPEESEGVHKQAYIMYHNMLFSSYGIPGITQQNILDLSNAAPSLMWNNLLIWDGQSITF